MVGCNCNKVSTSDPECCVGVFEESSPQDDHEQCILPVPKDFYCGYCESDLSMIACHTWIDCCVANKIATALSFVRFKTQSGRDTVFGMLRFTSSVQLGKHNRFPNTPMVDLNSPDIFNVLVALAAAAAFRDRLAEKTHYSVKQTKNGERIDNRRGLWSYNDASTAFRKQATLLKSMLLKSCYTRATFEKKHSLTWVKAGSPIITVGDSPFLAQLNEQLEHSCYNLWMTGAFAVVKDLEGDDVKYNDDMILYPVNPWNTPIECRGKLLLFRSNGSIDIVPYQYFCRRFVFLPVERSLQGTKEDLTAFIDSVYQSFKAKSGKDIPCAGWLDVIKGRKQSGADSNDKDKGKEKEADSDKTSTENPDNQKEKETEVKLDNILDMRTRTSVASTSSDITERPKLRSDESRSLIP